MPWRKLYAFRILHDHHYRAIELPHVLNTLENHLPHNLIAIEKIENQLLNELEEINYPIESLKFKSKEKQAVLNIWGKFPELGPE